MNDSIVSGALYRPVNLLACAVWMLLNFVGWFLTYTLGAALLKMLFKLRYEVFNEDLKLKRENCEKRALLITGATSGIGLAVAHYFHARGFPIVGAYYSRNEPGYLELERLAPDVSLVHLDVRSTDSISECYRQVRQILAARGLELHALINVAGMGCFYKLQWMPRELIRAIIETNLLGPVLMTRQFVHLLAKCPGSRLINVASPLAFIPNEFTSVYGATKAGLTQFTAALDIELHAYDIHMVTIHPGNLIRNTAIISSSMRAKLDPVWPELNAEERALYGPELKLHQARMESVDRELELPPHHLRPSSLATQLTRLGLIVTGAVPESRLEQNANFMHPFDNAVRLARPPIEMCAGNAFFNLIVGSLFESLSRALWRDMYLMAHRWGITAEP